MHAMYEMLKTMDEASLLMITGWCPHYLLLSVQMLRSIQ